MKRNEMKLTLYAAIMVLSKTSLLASSPASPRSFVVPSYTGEAFFLMVPKYDNKILSGTGTSYHIEEDGKLSKIWQVSGWYVFPNPTQIFLGSNGHNLVRLLNIGDDPPLNLPSNDKTYLSQSTVLEFYEKGTILKKYLIGELVDVKKLVPQTSSRAIYEFVDFRKPVAPQLGLAYYFTEIDFSERIEIQKKATPETEFFALHTTQSEFLIFNITDGSLVYRRREPIK